ncbi:hypothetical protein BH11PSE9_BH11PSE9_16010 [soil metagenome]
MNTFFQRHVLSRLWATFIALGLGLLVFGACTVNLGLLLMANLQLLQGYGWQAVMDGAIWQLLELVLTGYAGLVAYVIFKSCEHRLTDWLAHGK